MRIYDPTMILQPGLRDFLIDLCEEEHIPYQIYVSTGGTDAGQVQYQGKGVPAAVIGLPARYIHSHTAIMHQEDYEAAKRLLFKVIRKFDRAALRAISAR